MTSSEAVLTFLQNAPLCLTSNGSRSPSPSLEGSPTSGRFYPLIGNFVSYTSDGCEYIIKDTPLSALVCPPCYPGQGGRNNLGRGICRLQRTTLRQYGTQHCLMKAGWGATHSQVSNSLEIKEVTTWVQLLLIVCCCKSGLRGDPQTDGVWTDNQNAGD